MSSSHPTPRRSGARPAVIDAGVYLLARMRALTALAGRAVLFWTAVILAPCVLVLLLIGFVDLPILAGLVVANVLALVGGHDYRPAEVESG